MFRNYLLFFFIFVFICIWGGQCSTFAATAAETIYTLSDIYLKALERSESVHTGQENLYIAHQERKRAISALLPNLSGFGSYNRYYYNENSTNSLAGSRDASFVLWGLQASQTFSLNGNEFISLEKTEEFILKREYDLKMVEDDFFLYVAAAYIDVLKGVKSLDIAKTTENRLSIFRDSVSLKTGTGMMSKTDLLNAEAELSNAKAIRISSENDLNYAKAVLTQIANLPDGYHIEEMEIKDDPTERKSLAELKDLAHSHRADLKSTEQAETIADNEARHFRGAYWPTVTIDGAYAKTEMSSSVDYITGSDNFSFEILVTVPLFDGGLRRSKVNEALAEKRKAQLAYSATKKRIDLEVEQSYYSVLSAKGSLDARLDQEAYARANYESILTKFQLGMVTGVDVTISNESLVKAERQLLEAKYAYELSILMLNRDTGGILNDLKEIAPTDN